MQVREFPDVKTQKYQDKNVYVNLVPFLKVNLPPLICYEGILSSVGEFEGFISVLSLLKLGRVISNGKYRGRN